MPRKTAKPGRTTPPHWRHQSKELGGQGYNQLVLDDTPGQLRTQLHTTQNQTWLQMGHLLHQADNHRAASEALVSKLRTDAWGGLRAARGVMLSTFGLGWRCRAKPPSPQATTPRHGLGQTSATVGHHLQPRPQAPTKPWPWPAHKVNTPNCRRTWVTRSNKINCPTWKTPTLPSLAKAGVGITAGQDLILSANDTTQIASGQDSQIASGGQARVHTGQAIGILAGAIQAGNEAAGKV